jgi:serine/threonine-protein kinase
MQHTYYEVLGLKPTASQEDIKKRYRELARRFHPDVAQTGSAARFKAIQEAYNTLSDPQARAAYDATLKARTTTEPGATASGAPPPPRGAPPSADIIAGKYRIIREIARSNDVVYEATDIVMGRRCAVKELVLPANLVGSARRERIDRFNREARAAGKLSHPNIVTIFSYGEDEGRYYIAMEYLEGGTLRDALQQRGALPVDEAISIASQVLQALAHAHLHNVIHRDVKPDNIHLLPGGLVKLTDFGIARLTEEASLTGEGQVFGTPSFMSPEQIEGKSVDHRTDLFSLGVVLYEMLMGRKPFIGDSVVSITYSIMHHDPPPMAGVPFAVAEVVQRALMKDPRARYSTADEMRLALLRADTTPPIFLSQPMGAAAGGMSPGTSYGMPTQFGTPAPPAPAVPTSASPAPSYPPPTQYGGPPPTPQQNVPQPFVTWGPPGTPGAPPPPTFGRPRPAPTLSPAAKTFLAVLLASFVIAGALVGAVLLFLRAYEEQQKRAAQSQVAQVINLGNIAYQQGDFERAAEIFEQALKMNPNSVEGRMARTNLATTRNRMGVRAYERGDLAAAERNFAAVDDLYANPSDVTSEADRRELENARYNLGKVYDRLGDTQGAMRAWQRARESGRVGGVDPAAPGSVSELEKARARAAAALAEGSRLYQSGAIDEARKRWQEAAMAAPGTPESTEAQRWLDETASRLQY